MEAIRRATFIGGYAPTQTYMTGLQGCWAASDYKRRGKPMAMWILEEKDLHMKRTG